MGATRFVKLFLDFETSVVDLNLSSLDGSAEFALELARVISDGNLPRLVRCDISKNSLGRQGCERLMEVRAPRERDSVNGSSNPNSSDPPNPAPLGICPSFAQAFEQGTCPCPRRLNLSVCTLSDAGVHLICLAMRAGVFKGLEALDLSANNARTSMVFVAEVLKLGSCPALRELTISKNVPPGERKGLPFCFRDKFFRSHERLKIVDEEEGGNGD